MDRATFLVYTKTTFLLTDKLGKVFFFVGFQDLSIFFVSILVMLKGIPVCKELMQTVMNAFLEDKKQNRYCTTVCFVEILSKRFSI